MDIKYDIVRKNLTNIDFSIFKDFDEIKEFISNNYCKLEYKNIRISKKVKTEEIVYFPLEFLTNYIEYFYKKTLLNNAKYCFESSKILKIDNNGDVYSLSNLEIHYCCMLCGNIQKKRGHSIIDALRSKCLLCKNCSCSISHKNKEYKLHFESAMLEKYNVAYPMREKTIISKFRNTMLERYGVEYSSQSKDIREKCHATMLKRYGKKALNNGWNNFNNTSKTELFFIEKIIDKLNEKFNNEFTFFWFKTHNFYISKECNFNLDFYIKEIKYALEIDGDFWHANPSIYDKNLIHPVIGETFDSIYKKHIEKISIIKKYKEVKFLRNIWTSSINENIDEQIEIVYNDILKLKEADNV